MEYTVFISRTLKDHSPFFSLLDGIATIKAYSLLEFSPVRFVQPAEVDMIFFYSSNAVRFFFSQLDHIPSSKFCCIGEGTAKVLKSLGHQPYFVGTGNPESVAKDFLKLCKNKRVLFPRAQYSKKSIQNLIKDEVEVLDLVVYENSKKAVFPDPKADVLVFTSPMNAEAYFEQLPYRGEKLLAIGQTTLKGLESLGFKDVAVSEFPTELALADAARKLIADD